MTTNLNRQPAGVPVGGQFAASTRSEAGVALGSPTDSVGSCPDCGTAMPGRMGVTAYEGRDVDVFVPGTRCPACPHMTAEIVFESDPDDEGYWVETQMREDGQIISGSYNPDGDHVERIVDVSPLDVNYDTHAGLFGVTSTSVQAALAVRNGTDFDAAAAPPITTQDRITMVPAGELRVGDTVLALGDSDRWNPATITSLDNDHKSTSVELDGDGIASYGNNERFFKVERGALFYVEARPVTDLDRAVYDIRFRADLVAAKPGDRLADPDGDIFTLGASTATRYYDGCAVCADAQAKGSDFFPTHKASSRCQSGGRNHCTCGTCW